MENHRYFHEAEWALPEEQLIKIANLADLYEPNDHILKLSRLFKSQQWELLHRYSKDMLHNAAENKLGEEQEATIEMLFQCGDLDAIFSLAECSDRADLVGFYFAKLNLLEPDGVETVIRLYDAEQSKKSQFAEGYINAKFNMEGFQWLDAYIDKFEDKYIVSRLFCALPINDDIYGWITTKLGENIHLFWECVNVWNLSHMNIETVLSSLSSVSRNADAVRFASQHLYREHDQYSSPSAIAELLENLEASDSAKLGSNEINHLVTWLEEQSFDMKRLSLIEWIFFVLLDDKNKKSLYAHIASDAEFFMLLIRMGYKRTDGASDWSQLFPGYDEEKAGQLAEHSWKVLHGWKTVPGANHNGELNVEDLNRWLDKVLDASQEHQRLEVALTHIGHVLFYSPKGTCGFFIDEYVASILDRASADSMRDGFYVEAVNSRGVHGVDYTGKSEFALEQEWKTKANDAAKRGYFRLAKKLRELAERYHSDGERTILEGKLSKLMEADS